MGDLYSKSDLCIKQASKYKRILRLTALLMRRQLMSSALCDIFKKSLTLTPTAESINLAQYTAPQQAEARQWITLSARFPSTFPELNTVLRETTYLLGTQEATDVDAFTLAKASPFLAELTGPKAVEFRHIVRWADLVQHAVQTDLFKPDLSLDAPREIPKKKEPTKGKDGKDGKKDKKDKKDKKEEKDQKDKPKSEEKAAGAPKKEGKKDKKEKKEKKPQAAPAPAAPVTPGRIDFRVGFIQEAVKHPDADSLYVSTIDVGEPEPRTICSGLVRHIPLEEMQKRFVVVVANLKPVKMRGIVSNGMVLCASNGEKVEIIEVPENSTPGDKIFFEGFNETPDPVLNPKKKVWEQVQPDFATAENLDIVYRKDGKEHKLVNEKNQVFKAVTIKNGTVS